MTQTEHYSLNKPEGNDYAKISALNENADTIDGALHGLDAGKAPATHAAQHAASGSDPVTPEAIGARPDTWVPAWGDITGKPSTFTPAVHKSTHAAGGSDPVTPAAIGAAAEVHSHDDRYFTEAESLTAATKTLYGLGSEAVPDDVFVRIKSFINAGVKIAAGIYTGTGTYGSTNKNSLAFTFSPKTVIINKAAKNVNTLVTDPSILILPSGGYSYAESDGVGRKPVISVINGTSTVTWYHADSAASQFNESSTTYSYTAIG